MIIPSYKPWYAAAFPIALLVALPSCTTREGSIQTPSGLQQPVEGPLHILRILRRTTTTGNQPNALGGPVEENVLVRCPAGTVTVIPILHQEAYGYGEIEPDDLSMIDPATGALSFSVIPEDHHLGAVFSSINVIDVNAPGADGEQTVTLRVSALLRDRGPDDRWWWAGSYHILCIGNPVE